MKRTDAGSSIAIIGELNVDLIATGLAAMPALGHEILAADFQMVLGSASAIFACGAARLGHPVTFISQVGKDDFGSFCLAELKKAGVRTNRVRQTSEHQTGVTISLSTQRDRALVTFLGAIAEFDRWQVPLNALRGHSHLHLTSYFLQHRLRPTFPGILAEARRMQMTTSFDPNSDPGQSWGKEIRAVCAQTDVLFLNETEARQLTKCQTARAALRVLGQTTSCVVIKQGAKGALAMRDKQIEYAPGFKVNVVDTTGAGDSFAAGFMHGYVRAKSLGECLRLGNACGALSTLKAGGTANQPNQRKLREFLRSQPEGPR